MAIKKDIATKTGSIAGYWKIKSRQVDDITGQVVVALYGYRNRAHRDEYPNNQEDSRVITTNKVFTNDGTRAELYTEIQVSKPVINEDGTSIETNEFIGSIDV